MRAKRKRLGAPAGPRAVNIAETREKILKAAIEQFAQKGLTGARIESICAEADVNPRMVYHYYKDKEGLYVAVLEQVLGELRAEELALDVSRSEPFEGLLTMFDFIFGHFAKHPELIRLLSSENLLEGAFLKNSVATPIVASPVVEHIDTLLKRGEATGSVRSGLDALHLYVVMVGLSYFHKSNAHTLSIIWNKSLTSADWQEEHRRLGRDILVTYLRPAPKN
ncbi:MAG: TetR family transcriptional regulator [Sneathiella sp.]|nr:TetR family transcriptional regulator [Sneathiella sp.]